MKPDVQTRQLLKQNSNEAASKNLAAASERAKELIEFLAGAGPLGNFLFGVSSSELWSMIEGMQLIAMYPLLQVNAPANLGLLQAVLRKISTFEIVDGDWIKENVWQFDEEESVDMYFLEVGYDSVFFMFTFGLPLYIFAACLLMAFTLPLINQCTRTGCN